MYFGMIALFQKNDIYVIFLEQSNHLPYLAVILGHGGDFIGYLLGGELDVVFEGEALLSECLPVSNIILFISRGVRIFAPGRSVFAIFFISWI